MVVQRQWSMCGSYLWSLKRCYSTSDKDNNYLIILNENTHLKILNGAITERLKELSSDEERLTDKNGELSNKNGELVAKAISNHLLVEQNKDLRQSLEELKKENSMLKSENDMLRAKLSDVEKRISDLETRDNPITIREAVRILESYICLDAVNGSKTKFRNGNFNLDAISKTSDPMVTAKLSNILSDRGLSKDHLVTISHLKDCGDYGAHASRPVMTKVEWIEALTGEDLIEASEAGDKNDEEEKQLALAAVQIKTDLLRVLEYYNPCPATGGVWEIKHPVDKPMKVPVLKLCS